MIWSSLSSHCQAVELGLSAQPFTKTSLSPGSRVVTKYLKASGLLPYLQRLGFHIAGYGCMTCIVVKVFNESVIFLVDIVHCGIFPKAG
ncbi:hypothetical protein NECAME_08746 [Necator americanus]|uniref:Aconitase/3-isopropylmalate dehydratase large subunit alpha/beta/alpha domain-containing protein n=1 Tax=Necator americanus TaxID=51031 RepID=W2THK6_NECAM|nr:hypothetical protein NECAME_08746 [Necator americanus]ETN81084.1 hypothetical protein NECAME_08746 [Necator americanus]